MTKDQADTQITSERELVILRISLSDDGYHFYIFGSDEAHEELDSADGGVCTSTIEDALDMVVDQTKDLLKRGW